MCVQLPTHTSKKKRYKIQEIVDGAQETGQAIAQENKPKVRSPQAYPRTDQPKDKHVTAHLLLAEVQHPVIWENLSYYTLRKLTPSISTAFTPQKDSAQTSPDTRASKTAHLKRSPHEQLWETHTGIVYASQASLVTSRNDSPEGSLKKVKPGPRRLTMLQSILILCKVASKSSQLSEQATQGRYRKKSEQKGRQQLPLRKIGSREEELLRRS